MISYYFIYLATLLLFQSTKEGKYLTLVITLLIFSSSPIMDYYLENGLTVYESAVRFEYISLLFLSLTAPLHKNGKVFFIVVTSFLINYLYTITSSYEIQYFIYNNYKIINKFLFEMMAAVCFVDTRLYHYLKDKLKREESC